MICRNCQKENATDALFCKYCGTAMNLSEEVTQQATPEAVLPAPEPTAEPANDLEAQAKPIAQPVAEPIAEPAEAVGQPAQEIAPATDTTVKKEPLITINPAVVEQAKMYKDEALAQAKVYTGEALKGAQKGVSAVKGLDKKKKQLLLGIVAAILLIVVLIGIGGSSPEEKIIGQWQITEESKKNDYFSKNVRFSDGGICVAEGITFTYYIDGDCLYMDSWIGDYTYYFKFQGEQLLMKEDSDDPWAYYDKVS
ncbi:MAG: hypothetical protein E7523_05240 [Ruminococcaceae bacterium]|nr:hypothetical protein [Oscillospiraceae bacterium]